MSRSRETLDLRPKCYATAADSGETSVMAEQVQMGVAVTILTNACKKNVSPKGRLQNIPDSSLTFNSVSYLYFII